MTETTIQAVEMAAEKPYTLRTLGAADIAPMTGIITKIGFREFKDCLNSPELKSLMQGLSGKDTKVKEVEAGIGLAFEIGGVILANYAKCQDDIFKFLASLSGMEEKEVAELPLDTFAEMLIDVFKKKEFASFFSVVSKLFK